jgi:hypothetical protein
MGARYGDTLGTGSEGGDLVHAIKKEEGQVTDEDCDHKPLDILHATNLQHVQVFLK